MERLETFLEEKLSPLANWIARNKYLQTLSQTFISLLPVIIIGAFSLILSKSPISYTGFEEGSRWYEFFKTWTEWSDSYLQPLKFINSTTLGSLSLWVTLGIAYRWANQNELDTMPTITVAFVNFMLTHSITVEGGWSTAHFGGTGLFSAILIAFLTVELYKNLVKKGIGTVKFPATVPASLSNSINSMLPMAITMLAAALVGGIITNVFNISIPEIIQIIGKPLNIAIDNPIGISLVITLGQIGWFFGIHNSAVLSVFSPLLYTNLALNAEAFAAGVAATELPTIVNQGFFYMFVAIGGAGATFSLVLLMLRSKSSQLKTVGKLSIVPACFGINEPIIFGLPMMLNVRMLFPFIFVQIANVFIVYYTMLFKLVGKPIFYTGGTSPELLKPIISNLDWRSAILWLVLVIVDLILWYPFFKAEERVKLKEEKEKELLAQ